MDFKKTLEKLKKDIDKELEKYLSGIILEADKQDKEVGIILKHTKKIIMNGGKRIRPILMYFGYVAAGGKDRQKILKASIGIEIIHNYLLVHDDIMDHAKTRHNIETIDTLYGKIGTNIFSDCRDQKHLGNSMAIIAGDLLQAFGTQIFLNSGFDSKLIAKAISDLQSIIITTVVGQVQDICIENKKQISEKEILAMYENKTAKYTIEGPLRLGAILARADEKFLQKISLSAIPIGIAFQIQDDILGLFETSKKIGKDAGSDIRGGKKTLLVAEALKRAGDDDKKFMQKMLGNKNISQKEIEKFQSIIKKTGSLEYNLNLAKKLIEKGKAEIEKNKMDKEAKTFLVGLADYLVARKV